MLDGRILIKACLNGARSPDQHPAVPVTPEGVARAAREAVDAGAAAIHIHPRGGDGKESLEAADVGAAVAAVRGAVPGVPVGVTTGIWIQGHPARLETISKWQVLPDFASVNFFEEGAIDLCRLLIGMGVAVEGGVFNLDDTRRLIGSGLGNRFLRVLVEVGRERERGVEAAAEIDDALKAAGIMTPRLHHGSGEFTWKVLAAAIDKGCEIRVGLEDTLVLPDGSPARDNADLVAAAAHLVRERGRTPAVLPA